MAFVPSADYVIVGAGVAGCTLAARLQKELPSTSIVLIEAGLDHSNHPLVQAFAGVRPLRQSNEVAWQLDIAPNKNLSGRSARVIVGKCVGGSGVVNAGLWTRGPATDYDLWAEMACDPGWSYNSLLPYFQKTEKHHGIYHDEKQRGYNGPVEAVSPPANLSKAAYPLRETIKKAWEEVGVPYIRKVNTGHPLGLSDFEEVWIDGKRPLPGKFYDLSGISILTGLLVHKVTLKKKDGKLRATGVDLVDGRHISANKEVIISAGTFHSPKILMLSGIGDSETLEKHSIPIQVENTEVGKNLIDHLAVGLTWKLLHPEKGLALGSPLLVDPSYANGWPIDFIQFGQVPLPQLESIISSEAQPQASPTTSSRRLSSKATASLLLRPDVVHSESIILYTPMGIDWSGVEVPFDGSHITSIAVNLQPTSRGSVTITSPDPMAPPFIDANFNATTTDRHILRTAMRQLVSLLLETPSGKSFIAKGVSRNGQEELSPQSSDDAYDARVRDFSRSLDHPMGTCAMGKVVDSQCRVMGVEGLRVIDASILPIPISAQLQVTIYAIAERMADLISKRQS